MPFKVELEKEKVVAPDVLGAARQHMLDRAATYDKPEGERSMAQTVAVFNTFHGTTLTEAQGWHFMQVLKDVRLFTRPVYHADSAEDSVAYAALKAEAKAAEKATPTPVFHEMVINDVRIPVNKEAVEKIKASIERNKMAVRNTP